MHERTICGISSCRFLGCLVVALGDVLERAIFEAGCLSPSIRIRTFSIDVLKYVPCAGNEYNKKPTHPQPHGAGCGNAIFKTKSLGHKKK